MAHVRYPASGLPTMAEWCMTLPSHGAANSTEAARIRIAPAMARIVHPCQTDFPDCPGRQTILARHLFWSSALSVTLVHVRSGEFPSGLLVGAGTVPWGGRGEGSRGRVILAGVRRSTVTPPGCELGQALPEKHQGQGEVEEQAKGRESPEPLGTGQRDQGQGSADDARACQYSHCHAG